MANQDLIEIYDEKANIVMWCWVAFNFINIFLYGFYTGIVAHTAYSVAYYANHIFIFASLISMAMLLVILFMYLLDLKRDMLIFDENILYTQPQIGG